MSKNKVGAPPYYTSVEDMQEKIDAYFAECRERVMTDSDGNVLYGKNGKPLTYPEKPLTITGLALALGFNSRQSLLNYQGKAEFVDTIMRAKAEVERYAEERLFDKDGANGAKFSLANNFEGWKEKQQIEAEVNNDVTIRIELTDEE